MLNLVAINRMDYTKFDEPEMTTNVYSVHDEVLPKIKKILDNAVREGMAFRDSSMSTDDKRKET